MSTMQTSYVSYRLLRALALLEKLVHAESIADSASLAELRSILLDCFRQLYQSRADQQRAEQP